MKDNLNPQTIYIKDTDTSEFKVLGKPTKIKFKGKQKHTKEKYFGRKTFTATLDPQPHLFNQLIREQSLLNYQRYEKF